MVNYNFGAGAPYMYDFENAYNATHNPSTMHVSDTGLFNFFSRYLLQRAISQFKWDMPKIWEKNYTLYCLYCWGFFSVILTNKYGVIPQGCTLKGYNVMYGPTNAVISNPLLKGIREPVIGKETEIVRLQPDYCGIWDLVSFYADMMAMTAAAAGSNIMASKLAYMFITQNKAFEQTYKKMFDNIASGQPAVFVDKNMLDETGNLTYQVFANNLKANYIAPELLENLHEWERRFDTEIGIPHTNTDKKERLVKGEVNANVAESYTRVDMWLETLQECCEKVNNMFGDIIHVDWRVKPDMGGNSDDKKRDSDYRDALSV